MKANLTGWVLYALALPTAIVGYIWMGLLIITFMADVKSIRFQGAGVITAKTRDWAKWWGWSTTIGRSILYHPTAYDETPEIDNRIEHHEFVHIRQFEDACVSGLVGGLVVSALCIWICGLSVSQFFGVWMMIWLFSIGSMLTNFLTGPMRFGIKGIYRDTEHERSAYAQTDVIRVLKKDGNWTYESFEELRDQAREEQEGLLR
jgi:hypothetical protein